MVRSFFVATWVLVSAHLVPQAQAQQTPARKEFTAEQRQRLAEILKRDEHVIALCQQGKYAEALPIQVSVLAERKEILGLSDHATAQAANNLGSVHQSLGRLKEARDLYALALEIEERASGPTSLNTAGSMMNLGVVLMQLDELPQAKARFEQALSIYRQRLGNDHPTTAHAMSELGQAFLEEKNYAAARPLLDEALRICRAKHGPQRPEVASVLNKLGRLLLEMGDLDAAKPLLTQALAIRRAALGPEHRYTLESCNNLATLLYEEHSYAEARPLFEESLAILRRTVGEDHQLTITPEHHLGFTLLKLHEHAAAQQHLEAALERAKRHFGESHSETTLILNNLAVLFDDLQQYDLAREHLQRALASRREQGADDVFTARMLRNIGGTYRATGDYATACDYYVQSIQSRRRYADTLGALLSESESILLTTDAIGTLWDLMSSWRATDRPGAQLYAHLFGERAAVFDAIEQRHQAIGREMPAEAADVYRQLQAARRELADLTLAPATSQDQQQRQQKLAATTQNKERLERELAAKSPRFAQQRLQQQTTPADLALALPRDAVLIEFSRYVNTPPDAPRDETKSATSKMEYTAFILSPDGTVKQVQLGSAKAIEQAIGAWRDAIQEHLSQGADEVRRVLWAPVEPLLPAGTRTVYIIADGNLHWLPWAAIPGPRSNSILLEDYALAVVPNGRWLLRQLTGPAASASTGTLLAVGGLAYATPGAGDKPAPGTAVASAARDGAAAKPGTVRSGWKDLPATRREAEDAGALAPAGRAVVLTGAAPTADRVLKELPRARWATLATHGFFVDANTRKNLSLDEAGFGDYVHQRGSLSAASVRNPLLQFGLVLAGDRASQRGANGDLLTGEEIAGLPLQNLELVVLSACESGIGNVTIGEGSFGLQRAFHLAGCRNVIGSLWEVDDEATAALMRLFYYKLWKERKAPLAALREAQLHLYRNPQQIAALASSRGLDFSKTVPLAGGAAPSKSTTTAEPRQWAGFILSGAGR